MEAKQRRQNKGVKPLVKVQILEEPHSDEVSPGVTRTLSPTITVKSSEATTAQTEESKERKSPAKSNSDTIIEADEDPQNQLQLASSYKSRDQKRTDVKETGTQASKENNAKRKLTEIDEEEKQTDSL